MTNTPIPDLEREYAGAKYAAFKKSAAKKIAKALAPFRKKKTKLLASPDKLVKIAARGAKAANAVANAKMKDVRVKIGLL
jgi:tryptophanyl-tRNA synthetase